MNLVDLLKKEHSLRQRDLITRYVGNDPDRFAQLITVFLEGPYRITQRASWPLSKIVESHPTLVRPHLRKLLANLRKPGLHDAVKRNTVRLLQFIELPKNLHGLTAEVCFALFLDKKEPVAIRVFAMTVLGNLASALPDLSNELIPLIEDELPYGTPGFVSRGRKILKKLKGGQDHIRVSSRTSS